MTLWMLLSLSTLTGCAPADAVQPQPSKEVVVADGLTLNELLYVDVRGAARATEHVRHELRALSPQARSEVAASMAQLVRNCPYTRASVQLTRALHRVVTETPLGEIDGGYAQSDWQGLRRGLTAHVQALDAMGVTLPLPQTGDYLFHADEPDWLLDDAALAAAPDPVMATLPLIDRVDQLVAGYDGVTIERIGRHRAIVESHTQHPWVLSDHLWAWRDALTRLRPFVQEPATLDKVDRMLEALELLGREGC
jgi:hypothetical protein